MSAARYDPGATGNSNYGWFGGGGSFPGPAVATVDRIDFSNDSVTASPRGSLSSLKRSMGATSGVLNIRRQKAGNYGWFGGGFAPAPLNGALSSVDRIDFSNDSNTASPRGTLNTSPSIGIYTFAATGNSNYGWFGGGYLVAPNAYVSLVNRINFSNDLATTSIRGSLLATRALHAATGNSNYGWFGGGGVPGTIKSTVERIDFSNDSSTASPRGILTVARQNLAATGNSNYGWFGGGYIAPAAPVANRYSTVDRIDFSNDSVQASPRSPLSSPARYLHAATGNSNYGWFGGGTTSGPLIATVERIDFSNDSVSSLSRGPLTVARQNLAATGNSNYGWFGGGAAPAVTDTVDRINFSNDSVTASARGLLNTIRSQHAATSNTTR